MPCSSALVSHVNPTVPTSAHLRRQACSTLRLSAPADSEGRLAVFIFPPGEHHPYRGAPLHVHHEQDEWIYVMTGEFVAEVSGERMRLKPGDSLLMPMRVPHGWSVAQHCHCGAIHLYTPAGLMETEWAPVAQSEDPKDQEARKAEFERHGLTLLGRSLTREEIDSTF
jgi:quercetin dioxygenase-like cupin family protein